MHPLSTHIQPQKLKTKTYNRSISALFKKKKDFQAQVQDLETIRVIYLRSLLLK